jgi:hypothetical protein
LFSPFFVAVCQAIAQFLEADEILMRLTRYQAFGVLLTPPTGVVFTAWVMAAFWAAVGAFLADAGAAASPATSAAAARAASGVLDDMAPT